MSTALSTALNVARSLGATAASSLPTSSFPTAASLARRPLDNVVVTKKPPTTASSGGSSATEQATASSFQTLSAAEKRKYIKHAPIESLGLTCPTRGLNRLGDLDGDWKMREKMFPSRKTSDFVFTQAKLDALDRLLDSVDNDKTGDSSYLKVSEAELCKAIKEANPKLNPIAADSTEWKAVKQSHTASCLQTTTRHAQGYHNAMRQAIADFRSNPEQFGDFVEVDGKDHSSTLKGCVQNRFMAEQRVANSTKCADLIISGCLQRQIDAAEALSSAYQSKYGWAPKIMVDPTLNENGRYSGVCQAGDAWKNPDYVRIGDGSRYEPRFTKGIETDDQLYSRAMANEALHARVVRALHAGRVKAAADGDSSIDLDEEYAIDSTTSCEANGILSHLQTGQGGHHGGMVRPDNSQTFFKQRTYRIDPDMTVTASNPGSVFDWKTTVPMVEQAEADKILGKELYMSQVGADLSSMCHSFDTKDIHVVRVEDELRRQGEFARAKAYAATRTSPSHLKGPDPEYNASTVWTKNTHDRMAELAWLGQRENWHENKTSSSGE